MSQRVFAYGSNMHLVDLARWMRDRRLGDLGSPSVQRALLPKHRLVWNYYSPPRRGGAANIEPCEDGDLPGVVIDVDARLLAAIDRKEGHPERYSRGERPRPVRLESDVWTEAWVYVVRPPYRKPHPVHPRREYLELMIEGARGHGLPTWHLELLLSTPVAD